MTTSLRERLLALADKAIWAAAAGNATDLQPDDVRMLREAAEALTAPASPPALEGMADRLALRMLVAAGFVTQEKANQALNIAHGFDKEPLTRPVAAQQAVTDEMVERALDFYYDNSPFHGPDELKAAMRGCLTAALAQPPEAATQERCDG